MARRLSAEGERVDRLILVSPQLPATDRSWPARARARVGALARRMRPRTAAPSAPGGPPPEAGEARFRAYRRIMLDYAPGPYDGALTLLWPADEGVAARARATRRWRRAAPDLRIRLVPGAHLTSITTHAAALAAAMRECLRGEA
jgi:thioesterase domain-containing protein